MYINNYDMTEEKLKQEEAINQEKQAVVANWITKNFKLVMIGQIFLFIILAFSATIYFIQIAKATNEYKKFQRINTFYTQTNANFNVLNSIELYAKFYKIDKYQLEAFVLSDLKTPKDSQIEMIASKIANLLLRFNVEDMYKAYYAGNTDLFIRVNRVKKLYDSISNKTDKH